VSLPDLNSSTFLASQVLRVEAESPSLDQLDELRLDLTHVARCLTLGAHPLIEA
jgi:hypothetical protein